MLLIQLPFHDVCGFSPMVGMAATAIAAVTVAGVGLVVGRRTERAKAEAEFQNFLASDAPRRSIGYRRWDK